MHEAPKTCNPTSETSQAKAQKGRISGKARGQSRTQGRLERNCAGGAKRWQRKNKASSSSSATKATVQWRAPNPDVAASRSPGAAARVTQKTVQKCEGTESAGTWLPGPARLGWWRCLNAGGVIRAALCPLPARPISAPGPAPPWPLGSSVPTATAPCGMYLRGAQSA